MTKLKALMYPNEDGATTVTVSDGEALITLQRFDTASQAAVYFAVANHLPVWIEASLGIRDLPTLPPKA